MVFYFTPREEVAEGRVIYVGRDKVCPRTLLVFMSLLFARALSLPPPWDGVLLHASRAASSTSGGTR